jgi:hypothetical protein
MARLTEFHRQQSSRRSQNQKRTLDKKTHLSRGEDELVEGPTRPGHPALQGVMRCGLLVFLRVSVKPGGSRPRRARELKPPGSLGVVALAIDLGTTNPCAAAAGSSSARVSTSSTSTVTGPGGDVSSSRATASTETGFAMRLEFRRPPLAQEVTPPDLHRHAVAQMNLLSAPREPRTLRGPLPPRRL